MLDGLFLFTACVAVLGGGFIACVLSVRVRNSAAWRCELIRYKLRFPRGLDPAAVTGFFAGLSGLTSSRWLHPVAMRSVMVEVSANAAGIEHHLLVRRADAEVVLAALRAGMPAVRVSEVSDEPARGRPTAATDLALSSVGRPLSVDQPGMVAARVLASLHPLGAGERVVLQWSARPFGVLPTPPVAMPRPRHAGLAAQLLANLTDRSYHDKREAKAARAKQTSSLFVVSGRIGVWAGDVRRALVLVSRVTSAMHVLSGPGVELYRRRVPQAVVGRALAERRLPVVTYPCLLNAAELAAVVAVPTGTISLPGLHLGGCRPLAPATDIPRSGRVIARSNFPGEDRPLALSVDASLRHLHAVGPTGVGKSTLLANLILQDIAAGHGVVVVDPKGDLVADVLDRVPTHRASEVVILDPTDDERPVGLNLLAGADRDPELAAEQFVGLFHQLYRAFWGPRTEDVLRSAVLTLAHEPGMTICELPLLLTDQHFRSRLVGRLDDPVALGPFWGWYEGMSDAERAQAIGPVMNKLRAFLLRRRLRNVLGQATPKLDLDQALATRKVILVPLAKGTLGEEAAALVGSLLVARVWNAVLGRSALPVDQRPTTFFYIDEFQDYLHLPAGIADILAQARGLGLSLNLAHQHLGQLPTSVREAVLANARSRVLFQLGAGDARTLAKHLEPHLSAGDLMGLDPYEVVATLSTGARVAPPVTGSTLPLPEPTGQGAAVRAASRERYGTPRADVERAIRARHEGRIPVGEIGRMGMAS